MESKIEVDCLAVSGGWNPTLHLTCHMNGRPTWDEKILALFQRLEQFRIWLLWARLMASWIPTVVLCPQKKRLAVL